MYQDMASHTVYTYRPNPLLERSFLIFRKDHHGETEPIGDYTVLDEAETHDLSELKLMNIIMQLNGDDRLVDLGEKTRSRLLFHFKPKSPEETRQEIVFYTYSGQGVSKENAILTLEGIKDE